jgi:hypothetical protein
MAEMESALFRTFQTRSEGMSREWYIKHDRKFRTTLRGIIRT